MASVSKRPWPQGGENRIRWVIRYTDRGGKRRMLTRYSKKEADSERLRIETEIEKGIHKADRDTITFAMAAERWLDHTELRYSAGHLSRATFRHYRSIVNLKLVPGIGRLRLNRIIGPLLQGWFDELSLRADNPVTPAAMVYVRLVLSEIFPWSVSNGYLAYNPMKVSRIKTQPYQAPKAEFLDKEVIRSIFTHAHGQMLVAMHTMAFTGLRGGELRALTWPNVDFANSVIKVRVSATQFGEVKAPKTRAGIRDVPLAPGLAKRLREWNLRTSHVPQPPYEAVKERWLARISDEVTIWHRRRHKQTPENLATILSKVQTGASMEVALKSAGVSWPWWRQWSDEDPAVAAMFKDAEELRIRHRNKANLCFVNEQGKMLYQNCLQTVHLPPLLKAVGQDVRSDNGFYKIHLHLLRHVAASLFIEQGLGPKRIQNIMGHKSIKTTFDIYGHLFEDREELTRAVNAIEPALLGNGRDIDGDLVRSDSGRLFVGKQLKREERRRSRMVGRGTKWPTYNPIS